MNMKKQIPSNSDIIDPVCLMKVHPGRKLLTYLYNNKNYYFCAETCRKSFADNPKKYLTSIPPKRKGLWGRYLERLNKATGGKPPKCCH